MGEEWRLGRGANMRVQMKHWPVLFYKSKYADRMTIGKKEIIDTAHYESLRRFYRDWLRPELMAVVAVGDFDKTQIYNLVKENFAPLTNRRPARERLEYKLPDNAETLVSIATDKELPRSTVSVFFKRDEDNEKVVSDYRRTMVHILYDQMLNSRLSERLQKPNPPFISARYRERKIYRRQASIHAGCSCERGQHFIRIECSCCGSISREAIRLYADGIGSHKERNAALDGNNV